MNVDAHGLEGSTAVDVHNVLIVDDDFDIVDVMTDILTSEGYAVHSARTGEDGLKVLRSASLPAAILLDVDMPILGGPGMAHEMLLHDAGEEKVPIILCSARDDLPALAVTMGTPYSLAKPFELELLLATLHRATHDRRPPSSA